MALPTIQYGYTAGKTEAVFRVSIHALAVVESRLQRVNCSGRQRHVWLIPLADEMQSMQVKLCYPLTMRAIPECLRDDTCRGATQIDYLYLQSVILCSISCV